jgi:hypothetical protein
MRAPVPQDRHQGIEVAFDVGPVLNDGRLQMLEDGGQEDLVLIGKLDGIDQLSRGSLGVGARRLRPDRGNQEKRDDKETGYSRERRTRQNPPAQTHVTLYQLPWCAPPPG